MIRKAELRDTNSIVLLAKEFFRESVGNYGLTIDLGTIITTIDGYITNMVSIVVEVDGKVVGVIGGMMLPSIFDRNQIIGQETIWFVDKEHRKGNIGLKLIKAFEEECLSQGANLIIMGLMGNLNTDILDKYYSRHGYKLLEREYIKRFS